MIYVVDKNNREAFDVQLEDMFRIRHDIYVGRRGWKALESPDGRDVDQFDTEDTVYLLGIDALGRVTSGLRLNPTVGPHLIKTLFSHTVTFGRVPVGERIYEFTRYFVVPGRVPRLQRRQAAGELLVAMFEYALAAGLSHISLLCDAFFMSTILEMGLKVRPLGMPTPYDEGTCIAVLFDVGEENVQSTRNSRGIGYTVLAQSPVPPPFEANDNEIVVAA
ncbi:MAG TPA: acyl-homoserine-lactone synthase [Rhizomicrobium sp.]|nr:acyl-homoserine-lactone synthase [Rhizomicrobium sp.]